jgi:hypothetical protein
VHTLRCTPLFKKSSYYSSTTVVRHVTLLVHTWLIGGVLQ